LEKQTGSIETFAVGGVKLPGFFRAQSVARPRIGGGLAPIWWTGVV
jgi:hypothetical protein